MISLAVFALAASTPRGLQGSFLAPNADSLSIARRAFVAQNLAPSQPNRIRLKDSLGASWKPVQAEVLLAHIFPAGKSDSVFVMDNSAYTRRPFIHYHRLDYLVRAGAARRLVWSLEWRTGPPSTTATTQHGKGLAGLVQLDPQWIPDPSVRAALTAKRAVVIYEPGESAETSLISLYDEGQRCIAYSPPADRKVIDFPTLAAEDQYVRGHPTP